MYVAIHGHMLTFLFKTFVMYCIFLLGLQSTGEYIIRMKNFELKKKDFIPHEWESKKWYDNICLLQLNVLVKYIKYSHKKWHYY